MLTNDTDATPPADAVTPPAPSPVPGDNRADTPSRSGPVLDAITRATALLSAAIGMTVLVAWLLQDSVILRFDSHTPMSANTALAVAVTALVLTTDLG